MDVGEWLRGLGLDQYEEKFRDDKIDADVLLRLTADDLKEIGVSAVGDRRRLLDAISALAGAKSREIPGTQPKPAPPKGSPRLGRAASNYGDVLRSRRLNGSGGAA